MTSIFSKKEPIKTSNTEGVNDTSKRLSDKVKKKTDIDSLSDSDNDSDNDYTSEISLSFNDIIKTIPVNASDKPNLELQKSHVEWRWRFFDLKGRKLVEISKKSPDEKDRTYKDNTGKWIKFELKGNWDQFLTKSKYSYVK